MRTTLRRQRDGSLRPQWYGHAQVDGREKVYPLCRWKGTPPTSGRATDRGDPDFEQSRTEALDMLKSMVSKTRSEADRLASLERIHAAKYNEEVEAVPLSELFDRWERFPRKRKPGRPHRDNMRAILTRFVEHCRHQAPQARTLDAIPAGMVQAFLEAEEARGVSARTWNVTAGLLRNVYRRLAPFAPAARLLSETLGRDEDTQHRQPFTAEELQRVFEAAKADPLLRPLVTCAATTAMRRGDVARLRWKNVDLKAGFVTVKTAKTGETVEVPIFPQLRPELEEAKRHAGTSPFVWPEAATLYERQADALNRRLRAIMHAAGFVEPRQEKRRQPARPALPAKSPATVRRLALAAIDKAPKWTEKRRQAARAIVARYLGGESVKSVARSLDVSPGTVSGHLNAVERLAGCAVIRRPTPPTVPVGATGYAVAEADPQAPRLKRASLHGWHSFRTTWVTLALENGLPMELVRRVTGHATVDVVLRNYFRPGREAFRTALEGAMPRALIGEAAPAGEPEGAVSIREACRIVETAKTLEEASAALRALARSGMDRQA